MAGVGRASGDPPAQPPAQAGSPRAGCTAPRSAGVGISPEKETPQPLWAAWARAPAPSEGRSSSSSSAGTSSASVCARCPLSCRWAPLERVWPCPPDEGGQDDSEPKAFGVCGALACTHFSMVRVKHTPLLVVVSNTFFSGRCCSGSTHKPHISASSSKPASLFNAEWRLSTSKAVCPLSGWPNLLKKKIMSCMS